MNARENSSEPFLFQEKEAFKSRSAEQEKQEFSKEKLNAFEHLELQPTRDKTLIKTAYRKSLSKYHPDKFSDKEKKEKAEAVTLVIIDSYKILTKK